MINEIRQDADQRMAKCVSAMGLALRKLRTGRASPSLIEHLLVEYYGTTVPCPRRPISRLRTLELSPLLPGKKV